MKESEPYHPVQVDYLNGEEIEMTWYMKSRRPHSGVLKYRGQWFVWPNESFPKTFRRKHGDDERLIAFFETALPYSSWEAAATVCRFFYTNE